MTKQQDDWMSIPEAAAAAQLPVRTVYNWVRSGSIESQKDAGRAQVRLADVRAKASGRETCNAAPSILPAPAASVQLPAPDAGMDAARCLALLPSDARYALPPELLAHLIRRFEQGEALPSIVEQLRLAPELVVEARRQYDLLVAASAQPSLLARMADLESRMLQNLERLNLRLQETEAVPSIEGIELSRKVDAIAQDLVARIEQARAEWSSTNATLERIRNFDFDALRALEHEVRAMAAKQQ